MKTAINFRKFHKMQAISQQCDEQSASQEGLCYTDIRNYLVSWSVGPPVKQILRDLLCVNLNPFWLLKLF
jgi:hypothetical protein